jgi:DNA-binding transcriptional regulator/RsmH inhibitor MraZ
MLFVCDDSCVKLYSSDRLANLLATGVVINNSESAKECPLDAQGRIVIPIGCRDSASIVDRVIAVGMGDHLEIWNADEYARVLAERGLSTQQ